MLKTVGINSGINPAILICPVVSPLFPLKFNNRGSAALDIETARIRDDQPVEGGMVSVELRTSGGLLLAKKGLTQTSGGVLGAMVDSVLAGDGPVEQELAYHASIPAGSGFLFAPVMAPLPSCDGARLRVCQILCLLLMAVGVAQAQNIVSPEELENMLAEKKKVEVVDVRPAGQFFARHIDGAINVPLADVKAHKFPKKKALVLYCGGTDCSLSRKAAKVLADKGYKDVRVLVGGLPAWQSKGYAVMPPAPAPAAVAHSVVPRITAAELIKALPGTCVVIDVRSKDEFSAGHIKGAVNIPLEDIPGGVPVEAKGKRLVVYSRLPARSAKAAGLLAENGFTVLELTGGLGVWAALGYPVEAGAVTAVK